MSLAVIESITKSKPWSLRPGEIIDKLERRHLLPCRGRERLPRDPPVGRVDVGVEKDLDAPIDLAHVRRQAAQCYVVGSFWPPLQRW